MAVLLPNSAAYTFETTDNVTMANFNTNFAALDKKFQKNTTGGGGHSHNATDGQGQKIAYSDLTGQPDSVLNTLATAANDFIVASGVGVFVKKTLAEVKTILGLGSAAYTASSAYATAAQGTTADAAETKVSADAHKADYVRQPAFGQTTGSANTYVINSTPALSALVDGVSAYLDINVANTGASTLNWDGKGAKSIVDSKGNALTSGKLPLNGIVGVRYNASTTNFQLLGDGASGNAIASDLLSGKTAGTDAGDITGSMVNNGASVLTALGSSNVVIPVGYHNGSGYVNKKAFTAGDLVNNTLTAVQRCGSVVSPQKILHFTVGGQGGVFRLKYTQQIDGNAGDNTYYLRVYKNGVAYGTLRTTTYISGVWTPSIGTGSYIEDLSFAPGDTIEFYAWVQFAYSGMYSGVAVGMTLCSAEGIVMSIP